ncbi:MAG: hypothetical protein LBS35_13385 [Synergistaceae bacterium]|jgi:hypothetical protein|nr:hypothetical protein [Synergistaceae bacterium]
MTKNIVCNVRMTEDERHAFKTATLKNKTTVQEVLYEAVKRYIAGNAEIAAAKGDQSHEEAPPLP